MRRFFFHHQAPHLHLVGTSSGSTSSRCRCTCTWSLAEAVVLLLLLLLLLLTSTTGVLSVVADDTRDNNCRLLALLDFTRSKGSSPIVSRTGQQQQQLQQHQQEEEQEGSPSRTRTTSVAWSHLAAAQLAVDHFNARNDAVVTNLGDLTNNCSLQLTLDGVADTGSSLFVHDVMDLTTTGATATTTTTTTGSGGGELCAMVGPYTNNPSREASVLAKGLLVPLISHGSSAVDLALSQYPFTTMTSVNLHPYGEAAVHFLRRMGRSNFLATLHDSSDFGSAVQTVIDNAAKESNPPFTHLFQAKVAPPFTGYEPNRSVRWAMERIKDTTYRTIVVGFSTTTALSVLADEAEALHMNTDEYVWLFLLPNEYPLDTIVDLMAENANMTSLLKGGTLMQILDGFEYQPHLTVGSDIVGVEDGFAQSWKQLDETFIESLYSILHNNNNNNMTNQQFHIVPETLPNDFFQAQPPLHGSGFMYDAVMLAGIGKCKEQQMVEQEQPVQVEEEEEVQAVDVELSNGNSTDDDTTAQARNDNQRQRRRQQRIRGRSNTDEVSLHQQLPQQRQPPRRKLQRSEKVEIIPKQLQSLLDTAFDGATGRVEYTETRLKRNRQRNTITWGFYNIREVPIDDIGSNITTRGSEDQPNFWFYLTDILQGSPADGNWTETVYGPFQFHSGSTIPPVLLHDPPDYNFLSESVRIFGLTLMAISLALSSSTAVVIVYYRKARTIQRYQPEFLYLLLVGTIVMTVSIFFISQDESHGWSSSELDAACLAFPWLLVLGFITIYGALSMKLWRLDRVLQARRIVVKSWHVFSPFMGMLLAAILVLLTWTIYDPLRWQRIVIDQNSLASYGQCQSQHSVAFLCTLAALMLLSILTAATMSWKTKDVDENFSEARWIFYAIFLQCQVLLIGIPILVILEETSADATYVGRLLLIWTVPVSTVLVIVWPKVHRLVFKRNRSSRNRLASGIIHISGITSSLTSGNIRMSGMTMQLPKGDSNSTGGDKNIQRPSTSDPAEIPAIEDSSKEHHALDMSTQNESQNDVLST
mmetsp:Transcript_24308/g.57583  ORF Transcript_24308/g.57583 Transcript_24308/m.57583 type:complete len:1041 (+) Transcript_24308:187-3309(+)|eukprot:CAMPEP_0113466752 /NCGR_PEP_ID=MMETSP0014_2-20120614/14443_1 /TAXON_ID=2857 /ORGANISM="Nitzschia sp." /LENGTH=1040 /DNA_ID=CAMNT_0000359003 /DNA_START=77 /DNA_END=3199 /DNA_ORIENTATION=- /assembly_acc=CAM_ASM_000159